MAHLYKDLSAHSAYVDRQSATATSLSESFTLYVGNLSFYTTEEQIYELFSKCGEVARIIMGLNRDTKTPCGFCFVEFVSHCDAESCVSFVNGSRLDDRIIRTDWDSGFVEGRQFGRGRSGGQVRDEYRTDYDAGRGGFGKQVENMAKRRHPQDSSADVTQQQKFVETGKTESFENASQRNETPQLLGKRAQVDNNEENFADGKRSRAKFS